MQGVKHGKNKILLMKSQAKGKKKMKYKQKWIGVIAIFLVALNMIALAPKPSETVPETDMREFEEKMTFPETVPEESQTREEPFLRKHPPHGNDGIDSESAEGGTGAYEETPENCTETIRKDSCNWYCKRSKDGNQPPVPQEFSFVEKHNAYYIDRKHSDKEASEKVIYLTFDAGYENGNVEKILDIMKETDVKGAFFILEHLARKNSRLVKRMAEEGHFVCNHTASHKDMTHVTDRDEFAAELKKMEDICLECAGVRIKKYYRPPEGRFTEQNLVDAAALGYKTVFWSFAYADWDNNKQMDPGAAFEKVVAGTHNGEVILLHPTSETNVKILKDLIVEWKKQGYRFGTLDELCAGS